MFLAILFLLFAAILFFKVIGFFFRATLGAGRLVFSLIFWPIIFLVLFLGFFRFLLPILIIGGIVLLVIGLIRKNARPDTNYHSDYIDVEYRERDS